MKRSIVFLLACVAFVTAAVAQAPTPPDKDVDQWVKEVREFKHAYLARELNLSREQQPKFFKVYDAMEDEIAGLNNETRRMSKRVKELPEGEVTDLEYDMATDALFNLKAKEAKVELRYLPEFKEILDKKQLFMLKDAERKFTMKMMRRHHDLRAARKGKAKN